VSTVGLLALVLTAVLGLILFISFPGVRKTFFEILKGTLIFVLATTLVALLIIAIFRIDIRPYLLDLGVWLTGNRVVNFVTIFPSPQNRVEQIKYEDTDGDGEKEWVVFYQFDLTDESNPGRSPYAGAVYDYDRGDPPVVFPYQLVPPDRDYLSEGVVRLELEDIVTVGETQQEPELLIYGQIPSKEEAGGNTDTDLNIFRQIPNSFAWELPRDEPRRYQVIGAFRGDGGVSIDSSTKNVTVINREDYDRSEIAVQTVYALDENRGTYMSAANPQELGAPISSEVAFTYGMPPEVLETPFPEKLVLGFYDMLPEKNPAVPPRDFLTGEALIKYDENNLEYFGFGEVTGTWSDVESVTVTWLGYAPDTEQIDPTVAYMGTEPGLQTGSVAFIARVSNTNTGTPEPIGWITKVINGRWKIDRRFEPPPPNE
jgi:hypothetical protein